jgi:hypothetical protein
MQIGPTANKKGGPWAAPSAQELRGVLYMPDPWMPFQLASIDFTAFSGSGT